MSNMSASLIEHETIKTTVIKAKELRRYVEPLITLSKVDSVANRRRAFAKLRSKSAVGKLFTELGPRYQSREGGYTRILKAGFRRGDSSMIAYMQLVDQPGEPMDDIEPLMAPRIAADEPQSVIEDSSAVDTNVREESHSVAYSESAEASEADDTTSSAFDEAASEVRAAREAERAQSDDSDQVDEGKPNKDEEKS